jgi:hypothetical protein
VQKKNTVTPKEVLSLLMFYTGQDFFTLSRGSDRPLHLKFAYVRQSSPHTTYFSPEVEGNVFLRNVGTAYKNNGYYNLEDHILNVIKYDTKSRTWPAVADTDIYLRVP